MGKALEDPDRVLKRVGGVFNRLDKIFNGELQPVLEAFTDAFWQPRVNLFSPCYIESRLPHKFF